MACELACIPPHFDELIAYAVAIAIVFSDSGNDHGFRNTSSIIVDLRSYIDKLSGTKTRNSRHFALPDILYLQLGFSLKKLRNYLERIYSAEFYRSKNVENRFSFDGHEFIAHQIMLLGNSIISCTPACVAHIQNQIQGFLAKERDVMAIASLRADSYKDIASISVDQKPEIVEDYSCMNSWKYC